MLFQHEIFEVNISTIIDIENDPMVDQNPLTKSIDKNRKAVMDQSYKIMTDYSVIYTDLRNRGSQNQNITHSENPNMEEEDLKYSNYLDQIKQKEELLTVMQKIDKFFLFIRNRAFFANTTLINFWKNFQTYQGIDSFIKCQLIYCLCGYYYYSLVKLKCMLTGEAKQMIFKEEHFLLYQKSELFPNTLSIINSDLKEAL